MEHIYVFLIEWDIPIYFIGGVVLLISLYQLLKANRSLRRAVFSLEREREQQKRSNALLGLMVSTAVVSLVLYVNLSIAPTLPLELLKPPTATPDIFAIPPLSSPTPLGASETVMGTPRPRVTPNLVATVTLPANLAPVQPPPNPTETENNQTPVPVGPALAIPESGGCNPAVNITQPVANSAVFGTVEFAGTASGANFGFYRLELSGATTNNQWVVLIDDTFTAVENNLLGTANLGNLPNDTYDIRLSVLSTSGQPTGQCTITIAVSNG